MPNFDKKIKAVSELKEQLSKVKSVVVVDYLGIKVSEDTELRKELREAGVEYKVIKNNIMSRACEGTQFESLSKDLTGPNAFAFGYDDAIAPARVLNNMSSKIKTLEFKSGVIEGEYYDASGVKMLASIPSKEELLAKLLGSMKAPLSNLAYVLTAIAEKKEQEA